MNNTSDFKGAGGSERTSFVTRKGTTPIDSLDIESIEHFEDEDEKKNRRRRRLIIFFFFPLLYLE